MSGLRLDFQVEGGLIESLHTLATRAEDLARPCAKWGAYKRRQVKELIAAGNFATLAESTLKKRRRTGTSTITRHGNIRAGHARRLDARGKRIAGLIKHYEGKYFGLGKHFIPADVKAKVERLKAQRESINRQLVKAQETAYGDRNIGARLDARGVGRLMTKLRADLSRANRKASPKAQQARREVLAEFERLAKGGQLSDTTLDQGRVQSLVGRMQRAGVNLSKYLGDKPFPKLGSTIRMKVIAKGTSGTVIVRCASGAIGKTHNEGGAVGNGANVPARTFMVLTSADIEVFKRLLIEHGVSVLQEAA